MSWLKQTLPLVFDRLFTNGRRSRIPIFPLDTVLYPEGLHGLVRVSASGIGGQTGSAGNER